MKSLTGFLIILLGCRLAAAQVYDHHIIFASPGPFRAGCGTALRLPEGTPVFIFWDADGDGPDATDRVPCMADQPCIPEDPYINDFSFPLSSNGAFISPVITACGPVNGPFLVYLRIFFGFHRDSCWTSPTLHLTPSSAPQTIFIAGQLWTCGSADGARSPCEPERRGCLLDLDQSTDPVCYHVCATAPNAIAVIGGGSQARPLRPPVIRVDAGCGSACLPSQNFYINQRTWNIGSYSGAWTLYPGILATDFGCVTMTLLDAPPCANLDTLTGRRDAETVELRWNTTTETGLDSFAVWSAWGEYSPWYHRGTLAARGTTGADYMWIDVNIPSYEEVVFYNLLMIDRDGREWPAAHIAVPRSATTPNPHDPLPTSLSLEPVYPNPFNATATIRLRLNAPADVTLTAYDVLGRHAAMISHRKFTAGVHSQTWNAANLPSGVCFIQAVSAAGARAMQKVVLLK